MTLSTSHPTPEKPACLRPVPRDVKQAIEYMRAALCRPISMKTLVEHCAVPERTLNAHFAIFIGVSPLQYLRRLRLTAAREALLAGGRGVSVTVVAQRYRFNHFGRFADQYRRCFGESPSATLRHGRVAKPHEAMVADSRNTTPVRADQQARLSFASRERPSIAVLTCRASANEPTLRCLAESVAAAIAAALCSVKSLAVMLPTSLSAAILDPQRIARELNARYFLTGRIVQAGPGLRLTLFVAETATGHHVWGDSFDGERDQPLDLQARIVAGIIRVIPPRIRGAEIDRASRVSPQNLDAYGLAMRALPFVFASRSEATQRALELLHRAIEIDPDYDLATALAAWCHGQLVMYNGTLAPAEETQRALQLVQRAAILDSDDPLVMAARCAVHTMARQFDIAGALVTRALALDPYFGWAWGRSGWLHSYRGNSDTAIEHFGRSLSLDPNFASRANYFAGIGSAHFNIGRYDETTFWLRTALLDQPGMSWVNRTLSVSYARLGDRPKALESVDTLRRSCPDLNVSQVVAALPFRPTYLDRLAEGLSDLGLPI